jgi:transcriptional regulator with XRE-family HTH domain
MGNRRDQLAKRRRDAGFSQEALAEHLGVSRATIARWERGDATPYPRLRLPLAEALGISPQVLDRLLVDDELGSDGGRLMGALRGHIGADAAMITRFRREIDRLDAEYESAPSTTLLPAASSCLAEVSQLRSLTDTPLRAELIALEAAAATLMGILAWDSSQRRQAAAARSYFDQAVRAAREIGDRLSESYAQLRISYLALYGEKDPAVGLVAAQHARELAPRTSHVLAGLTTLHIAEAHAILGRRHECEAALSTAESMFDQIRAGDEAIRFYSPAQLNRIAGSCYLFLGRPRQAERILELAAGSGSRASKAHAIVLGNLGLAHTRQSQIDAAVGAIHAATDVIERNRGGGGMNVVFSAALELRPWRTQPAVQEIHDRLLTLGGS